MIWMFCSTGDTDSANKVAEKLEELTVKDGGKTKTSDDKTGGEKKEDLREASLQLIFPGISGSLLVQQFGLGAPITGARARPPAWEPRSHKLHGAVKKRKGERKKKRSSTISKNEKGNKIRKIKKCIRKSKTIIETTTARLNKTRTEKRKKHFKLAFRKKGVVIAVVNMIADK